MYLLRELASLAGQGLGSGLGSGLGQRQGLQGLRPGLGSGSEPRSETGQEPELGAGGSGLDIGVTVDTYLEKV